MIFMANSRTVLTDPFSFTSFTVIKVSNFVIVPFMSITVDIELNWYSLNSD